MAAFAPTPGGNIERREMSSLVVAYDKFRTLLDARPGFIRVTPTIEQARSLFLGGD